MKKEFIAARDTGEIKVDAGVVTLIKFVLRLAKRLWK